MAKKRKNKTKETPPKMVVVTALPRGLLMRIEERLAVVGLTKWGLSAKAGLGETYMADLFNGKNTKPSIQALISIAQVLECSVAYLLGETYDPAIGDVLTATPRMPLVGIVETGAFRKLATTEPVIVARPKSANYPEAKHFSLQVNDDAMSASTPALHPGMEALCIDIDDAELPVEGGKVYAIRRTRDGETWETVLRRARVFRDRVELLAESARGVYEPIIIRGQLTSDRSQSVYAFGLVYGTFQSAE